MTATDREQSVLTGIHAVYEDRRYDVGLLGSYFRALRDAWRACLELATHRDFLPDAASGFDESSYVAEQIWLMETLNRGKDRHIFWDAQIDRPATEASRYWERDWRDSISLEISQLHIESPMEITLAVVQGGGAAGIVAYSIHLLVHVMRDPERVGAWLPRLVAGWHKGMTEAEQARQEHRDAEQERKQEEAIEKASTQIVVAGKTLKKLPATEVTALGAGEPPDDFIAALTD